MFGILVLLRLLDGTGLNAAFWRELAVLLVAPMLSGFITLNFTGATTFTSLSGVKKETKFAMPAMIASAALGMVIRIVSLFLT